LGCKDYQQEKQVLERVDAILKRSGLERVFLEQIHSHPIAGKEKGLA